MNGDLDLIKKLHFQDGAVLDYKVAGATPLTIACRFEQLHAAEWLLKQGVDLNTASKTGDTALVFSVLSGKLKAVKWLCDHGVDLGAKDAQGRPQGVRCIKIARERGHTAVAQYLEQRLRQQLQQPGPKHEDDGDDSEGEGKAAGSDGPPPSAAAAAAAGGGKEAAAGDDAGQLPPLRPGLRVRIHGLTSKQGRKINGKIARVMTKQNTSQSASGRICVKVVGKAAGKPISVHRSNLRTGDEASCAVCNEAGCELKACGICREMGLPRIYYCSRECQEEDWKKHKKVHKMAQSALTVPVSEEMRKRAEITLAVQPDHARALYEAARSGDLEMCAALIDCGVDPDGVVEVIDLAIATLLVSHGANVNECGGGGGHTPLGYACARGQTAIAEMLLENGADANKTAAAPSVNAGQTPFFATYANVEDPNKRDEIAKLLLANGAKPLSANEKQKLRITGRPVPE
eukprot:g3909.t1